MRSCSRRQSRHERPKGFLHRRGGSTVDAAPREPRLRRLGGAGFASFVECFKAPEAFSPKRTLMEQLGAALGSREPRLPDVPGEILGWKILALTDGARLAHASEHPRHIGIPARLSSPTKRAIWPERDWLRAECGRGESSHQPPEETCTCGIYAVADAKAATAYLRDSHLTVLAHVALAGKVIPGSRGWRGERARVVALVRVGAGADYSALLGFVARRDGVPLLDVPPVKESIG